MRASEAPKGQENSAWGFNQVSTLGYRSHQAARPERARERISCRRRFHRNNFMIVPIPNLPPFQGDSVFLGVFPGLKPWAESCCPFGTLLPASAAPEDKKSKFAQSSLRRFYQIGITTGPDSILVTDFVASSVERLPRREQCRLVHRVISRRHTVGFKRVWMRGVSEEHIQCDT
jgi:hypothetical protein